MFVIYAANTVKVELQPKGEVLLICMPPPPPTLPRLALFGGSGFDGDRAETVVMLQN